MNSKFNFQQFIGSRTAKLAGTYLAIIMLMSISYSFVFYYASAGQLQRRPMPPVEQFTPNASGGLQFGDDVQSYISDRLEEARQNLLIRLIWLNLGTLALGSVLSYVLARMSLRPIEQSMESQAQFISDASHELRTPLAVLQTTNEVALRKKRIKESEARDIIAHNILEVEKLKNLSNALLELLKSDVQTIKLKTINLQGTSSEAVSNVIGLAKVNSITIENHIPKLDVMSNKDLLVRLIIILLDNAIKYSGPKTTVTLAAKTTDSKVMLSIKDQGIGIKASELPYIFKRFYRADKSRSSQHTDGYGLGLSIAEKISNQLNISIDVKSEAGKGSEFTLLINK